MELVKVAGNVKTIKLSKSEWQAIGKQAGWMGGDRPLSDDDKQAPMFQAIINPSLRPNFPEITKDEWNEMTAKIKKGLSQFGSEDLSPEGFQDRIWTWD